uniref:Sugar phosphate transporter domain-containing protein n=1 Tax=Arundo donax TaxID=35708 RepID=A0A0A9DYT7_ARUDO
MDVLQIQFNYSIFFLNALSAFALNISIFLVIGRTGAVTIRVAGVLKDWILIALSTIIFPESVITSLNIIGYAVALFGVVLYNYLKMKDVKANQLPADNTPDRATKEKKVLNMYRPDISMNSNDGTVIGGLASEAAAVDEEAPLIPSARLSYVTRTQTGSFSNR